jgi:hypothetical protein
MSPGMVIGHHVLCTLGIERRSKSTIFMGALILLNSHFAPDSEEEVLLAGAGDLVFLQTHSV